MGAGAVLIVDDKPYNLRLLTSHLEGAGFEVRVASSGERALTHAVTYQPDVILLDVLMPGIDGFETCRQLKGRAETCEIPVVFMTALADTEHKVRGFQEGGVDYIVKPFQKDEVLARVATHVTMRRQQEKLNQQNAELRKLQRAIEQSPSAITITDLEGRIELVNPAFSKTSGYSREEVLGTNPRLKNSGEQTPELFEEMWRTLTSGRTWKGELLNRKKNGELYWEDTIISPVDDGAGKISHYLAIQQDITRQKRDAERIRYLARHDGLTGLSNRETFIGQLDAAVTAAVADGADGAGLAVMFVDLDSFKSINDTYGHLDGDRALQGVADRIRQVLRDTDRAGRLGGDEFGIQLRGIEDRAGVTRIAQRICDAVAQPLERDATDHKVTCSIGVAIYPDHGTSCEQLLRAADAAMYAAKRDGKNRVCIASGTATEREAGRRSRALDGLSGQVETVVARIAVPSATVATS